MVWSSLVVKSQHSSINCLDFDGVNDFVQIPNNTAFNPGKYFTVEAWINADSWATNPWQNTIVSKDQWSSISEGWVIRCGGGGRLSFNLALNNNGNWYEIVTGSLMSTNKWYHVAGTYDGTTMRLYLNGKQVGTLNITGTITSTTAPVKIGNIAMSSQSRYFDGEIDEVRIWDTVLTESTIKQYMCHKIDGNHPYLSNLQGHYLFNSLSGTTASDASGNNRSGTNSGATWKVSGVPLGDGSDYIYPSSWSNLQFKYGHLSGDSLSVSSVSGNPGGIHIYFIDAPPNYTNPPPGVAYFYSDRFYGIFPTSGSNVKFTAEYAYNGRTGITNQGKLNYNKRSNNSDSTWNNLTVTIDTMAKTIVKNLSSMGEFILGRDDDLSSFDLNSPISSSTFTIQGLSNQTIDFDWFSSSLSQGGSSNYRWYIDYDTANFSTPLGSKLSSSVGADTTVGVSYADLANIMSLGEIYYGQTLTGSWTVKATAGPVEKYADQPFDISITRGILSSDVIYAFVVDQPDDDTLQVYNNGSATSAFNWSRASSSAGPDLTYTVEIAGHSGNFGSPLGSFISDNSGSDTVANISDADLAQMLQNAGIGNQSIFRFKWRVKAEIGSLISYSNDSNFVYIERDDDPSIGIPNHSNSPIFELYPNPVKTKLIVKFQDRENSIFNFELVDCLGSIVFRMNDITGSEQVIDLPENLNNGVYFVRINNSLSSYDKRIIIQK